MKAVTAEVMQQLDKRTIAEYGIPGIDLMERAGANTAAIILQRYGDKPAPSAVIFAGKGNNGGDGYVIARLLAMKGWEITLLVIADRSAIKGDARANLDRLPLGLRLTFIDRFSPQELELLCSRATLLVDALFGTGLQNGLSGLYAEAAGIINSAGKPVLAVDIASGVDATTGRIPGLAVKADITVTFGAAKLGHLLYPGAGYTGELVVTDIGIPEALVAAAPGVLFVDESYASSLIMPRSRTAHKGNNGHLLLVAGSAGKSGAASMAANSAMRSGAGLVTLAAPASIHSVLEIKTTEAMTVGLAENGCGALSAAAFPEIEALLVGRNALAIGPGVGLAPDTVSLVRRVVATASLPLVLDADGLNAFSGEPSLLLNSVSPALLLTPHPGEMARLAGITVAEVEADRLTIAARFAADHNVYLILKGARTVIAAPDGRLAINGSGNPGMASGGMGDVLTGVLSALLAQGYEPFAACCLAVFCHGLAGDMAAGKIGEVGMIATDVQEMLPYAFKRLAEKQSL
jgi:NAD(P)H-hydrate epimerase